jgi:hypothetical protein
MSPDYVRRYVETNRLQRVERNVFELLRAKVRRLCRQETYFRAHGIVARVDAKRISECTPFVEFRGKVRLVVTSPPYLDVVNYAKQNWIRTWFLEEHHDTISEELDDNLTLHDWLDFADKVMTQLQLMLQADGVVAFVVGDVARPKRGTISLAREFIRRALHDGRFSYVGCLADRIQADIKTTRIWGDTKGQATAIDRIVLLSDRPPEFHPERLDADLFGVNLARVGDLDAERLRAYAVAFAS